MSLDALRTGLIDRYRIERELGSGGMATVYLAHDLRHDRDVAIKVLHPDLGAALGSERFLAEIRTTARLQHPHILPLLDSGAVRLSHPERSSLSGGEGSEVEGPPSVFYYVMPLVTGESLRGRLERERQLPLGDAIQIASEVASALDYAHRQGVIHRDIKPENILLHDGQALVADFGIALAAARSDGGSRMTETGMSLGTPHYMSPEQAMGERQLDARTDVYALGCVLYEMLTGEPPFSGPSAQAIIAKVMTERPTPPSATRDTVPEAVEEAVLTALAKLPVDRFASAAEFATALTGSGTGARHATAARRTPRADRRPLLALAALSAVLAVVAALGWSRDAGGSGVGSGPLAYQIHLTPSESDAGFVATQLAVSADGGVIVFSDTVGGTRQLWLKERGVAEPRPIPGTLDGQAPFLSPDGRSVAYVVDSRLLRIPITGGAPRMLSDSAQVDSRVVRGAWLDDGTIVFVGGVSRFLYAIPDTGGSHRRLANTDQLLGFPVGIAPVPGRDAAIVTGCDVVTCTNPVLTLVHIGSQTIQRILPGSAGAWSLRGDRLLNILPDGTLFLASFDPATGTVGEGTQLANGIAIASRGPELAVGVDGVVVIGVGGEGSFSNRTQLVAAGFDRTIRVIDTTWSPPFANNSRLELSPEGRRLLYSQVEPDGVEVALFVKPYPVGAATPFSDLGVQSARAVWSPDGQRIAWVLVGEDGSAQIWQRSADGSGTPTLVVDDPRGVYEVGFSPDGEWLVYRTDDVAAGSGDIYARRTRGDTTPIPVAATEVEETSATISPDGRWIAYSARLGLEKEVVVRPFPEVDAGRVQVSNGGGREPLWSRDGRTLYYRDPAEGQILAARMGPDGTFPSDGRSVAFQYTIGEYWDNDDTRQYSLTPDGTGFLLMRRLRAAAGSTPMRLILREHIIPEEGRE